MAGIEKRSLTLFSHATSIALESQFWDELKQIAAEQKRTVTAVVQEVDQNRMIPNNLSASLRAFVLKNLRDKINQLEKKND